MADTKISGLTSLTGANVDSASDTLPIEDHSATTTKKITRAQLFDISDAAGGQIVFPATQNSSTGANTFDDYEEGTWTPVLTFLTPGDLSVTYLVQAGLYTKIGRVVVLTGRIQTTAFTHSTAADNLQITGLPFTSITSTGYFASGSLQWQGITKAGYTQVDAYIGSNVSLIAFRTSGSGQSLLNIQASDVPSGGTVILNFAITYTAAQ